MPATIPLDLVNSRNYRCASESLLVKLWLPAGQFARFTDLNRDEHYDCGDGLGVQTWYASSGAELSDFQMSNDGQIDNAEFRTLVKTFPAPGIDLTAFRSGKLDTARYQVLQHDYLNGAAGVQEIVGGGVIGQVRLVNGMLLVPELREWLQLGNQTGLVNETSLLCQARRFGSQPGEERLYCGYDLVANGEWIDFTVTAVGAETERAFTDSALLQDTDYFAYGMAEWTGGDNTGNSIEIESFTSGGAVVLRFLCGRPIQIGDTGKIRRGCSRRKDGHNGCKTYFGADWGRRHRGFTRISNGDAIANTIPGTLATTNIAGTGEAAP